MQTTCLQIGQKLSFVDGQQLLDRFDLDDQLVRHDHVGAEIAVQGVSFAGRRQFLLSDVGYAVVVEFEGEAGFVGGFEQAGPSVRWTWMAQPMTAWVRRLRAALGASSGFVGCILCIYSGFVKVR